MDRTEGYAVVGKISFQRLDFLIVKSAQLVQVLFALEHPPYGMDKDVQRATLPELGRIERVAKAPNARGICEILDVAKIFGLVGMLDIEYRRVEFAEKCVWTVQADDADLLAKQFAEKRRLQLKSMMEILVYGRIEMYGNLVA